MRNGSHGKLLAALALAAGLAFAGCGGDDGDQQRTTPEWEPSERLPSFSQRWWWEPVERPCEEDDDCREGETCQWMRLATCESCPPGERARICVPRDRSERSAQR
ncbi:MAG TPA: hypothetical protein RMH99_07685 [Sandaracinaceae bacterium LLY-WYZ-13_1]|nr:hypothetical protein [Sandaracinaceae bacterium LLY-WYZ-13_1]